MPVKPPSIMLSGMSSTNRFVDARCGEVAFAARSRAREPVNWRALSRPLEGAKPARRGLHLLSPLFGSDTAPAPMTSLRLLVIRRARSSTPRGGRQVSFPDAGPQGRQLASIYDPSAMSVSQRVFRLRMRPRRSMLTASSDPNLEPATSGCRRRGSRGLRGSRRLPGTAASCRHRGGHRGAAA